MSAIVAFTLSSPLTQSAAPFMIGQGFKKGDVPSGQFIHADLLNFSVVPLCYWNDGSLKQAAIMGRVALTAGVSKQVNLVSRSSAPAVGTPLTAADIAAAAPTATFQAGAFGTASLAAVLASPMRTLKSTKEMVECQYFAPCGSDPSLHAIFNVQLFLDGRMRVHVIMYNSYSVGSPEIIEKDYIPTITVGGVVVENNAGVVFKHFPQTRHDSLSWIGTNPQVTPVHDTPYLARAKLTSNYWRSGASNTAINAWSSKNTYTLGSHLGFSPSMGATGYQEDIGILPLWDALYCASGAKKIMYDAVLAHGRAINSYRIVWQDPTTKDPIRVSDYPTYTTGGAGQGGTNDLTSVAQDGSLLVWEAAHHTSAGYLAYLLTADHYFLETCAYNAITMYLCETSASGSGVSRSFRQQNRGRGWGYRSLSQAASLVPVSLMSSFGHLRAWMAGLADAAVTRYCVNPPAHGFGYEDFYNNRIDYNNSLADNGSIVAQTAPWEHHFTAMAAAQAVDLEPCDAVGMVKLTQFSDYLLGAPVMICGGSGATEYNRAYLTSYVINFRIAAPTAGTFDPVPIANSIATNAAMIFGDTLSHYTGTNANIVSNTLYKDPQDVGGPIDDPTSYFANFFPAIAYAVDHGKAGAQAAFDGLIGASNFSAILAANYADIPIWGIVPRSYSQQPLMFTAVDNTAVVATPGGSFVWDTASLIPGGFVWSTIRGLGVLGSSVPRTGTNGGGYLSYVLTSAEDNFEVSGYIDTPNSTGTLTVDEYSALTYIGSNTTMSATYRVGGIVRDTLMILLNADGATTSLVSADLTSTYSINNLVAANLAESYAISALVHADLMADFLISITVGADLSESYVILSLVHADLVENYVIGALVRANFFGTYSIEGEPTDVAHIQPGDTFDIYWFDTPFLVFPA